MEPCLVFDIETVPDIAGLRLLHDFPATLSDDDVLTAVTTMRRQSSSNPGSNSDFLPHHLQRVIAISCVLRARDKLAVWSLGDPSDSES